MFYVKFDEKVREDLYNGPTQVHVEVDLFSGAICLRDWQALQGTNTIRIRPLVLPEQADEKTVQAMLDTETLEWLQAAYCKLLRYKD